MLSRACQALRSFQVLQQDALLDVILQPGFGRLSKAQKVAFLRLQVGGRQQVGNLLPQGIPAACKCQDPLKKLGLLDGSCEVGEVVLRLSMGETVDFSKTSIDSVVTVAL